MGSLSFLITLHLALLSISVAAPVSRAALGEKDWISFGGLESNARYGVGSKKDQASTGYPVSTDNLNDVNYNPYYGYAWQAHHVSPISPKFGEYLKPVVRGVKDATTKPSLKGFLVLVQRAVNSFKPASDSKWETDSATVVHDRDFHHLMSMSAINIASPTIRQVKNIHSYDIHSHTEAGHIDEGSVIPSEIETGLSHPTNHDHHNDNKQQSHFGPSTHAHLSGIHDAHEHRSFTAHSSHPTLAEIKLGKLKSIPFELNHDRFGSHSHDHDKPTVPFSKSGLHPAQDHFTLHGHGFSSNSNKKRTTTISHGTENSFSKSALSNGNKHPHDGHEPSAINEEVNTDASSQHARTIGAASDIMEHPNPSVADVQVVSNGAVSAGAPHQHPVTLSMASTVTSNPQADAVHEHSVSFVNNDAINANEPNHFNSHAVGNSEQAQFDEQHAVDANGSIDAHSIADHNDAVPHEHERGIVSTHTVPTQTNTESEYVHGY